MKLKLHAGGTLIKNHKNENKDETEETLETEQRNQLSSRTTLRRYR